MTFGLVFNILNLYIMPRMNQYGFIDITDL